MILFLNYYQNYNKRFPKKKFLLGNFNTDLLKYEISSSINNFINTLSSNFILPHMLLPKEYPINW